MWNETKDLAIRYLKGSSADGPRKLKTVVLVSGLWDWGSFEPGFVVEETVV